MLLRRAIESVLSQSFQDWLHVIINDGGNPGVVDFLAAEFGGRYRGRLHVIHNSDSIGMQNASNKALQATRGEFVSIHDDDDSWEPNFLETCVAHLDRLGGGSRVQGVVTHTAWIFEEIDANGSIVEQWRQDFPVQETITLMAMSGENRFPPIAFLYRRRAHDEVGYFNEEFSVLGDWDFNLRFLSRYDIDVVPEKLARWHWRQQGCGSAYGNSVTAGLALHKQMGARLSNHYLREGAGQAHPGLGHLMNVSLQLAQLERRIDELKHLVEQGAATAAATLDHAAHLHRITRELGRIWEAKEWVRRGVAIVRERRCPPPSAAEEGWRRDVRNELDSLVAGLQPGQVLSLDVFDTALLRVLRQPTDLFAFIEPEVRAMVGMPELPFAQLRLVAERVARQRHVAGACEDVDLRQVYDVLADLSGMEPGVAARVMELELVAERRLCYANPVVRDAARAARARGIRVIFVSDMYLSEDRIRDLLVANGYEAPDVFVSSREGRTKYSGGLFSDVLQELECPAECILHIGDHPYSDDHRPRGMGIRTLHVERREYGWLPWVDQHAALSGTGGAEVLSSVYTGLVRRQSIVSGTQGDIWDRLGYEVAGPILYTFVRWIAQQARAKGVRRLFYLSRDGYLLEKAFATCAARWGLNVESVYLYSSRRLLNVARIDRMDDVALDFLLTANPFLRVRDYLERIGLTAEPYAADAVRAGLPGLDAVLTTHQGYFRTPQLRENMKRLLLGLQRQVLDIAQAERRKLMAYFEAVGFTPGPIAIVDLGWQASSIRSLQDLLRLREPGFRLGGYYFGTWPSAKPAMDAGCDFDSFFCHLGLPARRASLLAECVELVEHLFAAPHPTVVSLEQGQEGWKPVCGEWETTPEQRQCLAKTSNAAMAFVEDMLQYEAAESRHAPPFGYLESVLERVLRHPTRDESVILGALPHRDSFGGVALWRCLAKIPSTARAVLKPGSVREAYEAAYWKRGMLAQLSPTERGMAEG